MKASALRLVPSVDLENWPPSDISEMFVSIMLRYAVQLFKWCCGHAIFFLHFELIAIGNTNLHILLVFDLRDALRPGTTNLILFSF